VALSTITLTQILHVSLQMRNPVDHQHALAETTTIKYLLFVSLQIDCKTIYRARCRKITYHSSYLAQYLSNLSLTT
jgi:hypothetical protein